MYNSRPHPLLEQIPLTVSPFVPLPTAPTLPYNYQQMPSSLPPSIINAPAPFPDQSSTSAAAATAAAAATSPSSPAGPPKPRYVVSNAGHAAHPTDILATCKEMHAHLDAMRADAERDLAELREVVRARELAERRRIAPGWLDSEVRVLEPERKEGDAEGQEKEEGGKGGGDGEETGAGVNRGDERGAELDRAFGSLRVE